ncbi:MAG TPA: YggT family protein [Longimicrobium sp.]|nr:YggT family protein [Longimicrobium sp.]
MIGWQILLAMLRLLEVLIIVRVILSWVAGPYSRQPLVQAVRTVTDPIVRPIQGLLPPLGGFDFSPIVAIVILHVLQQVVARQMLYA